MTSYDDETSVDIDEVIDEIVGTLDDDLNQEEYDELSPKGTTEARDDIATALEDDVTQEEYDALPAEGIAELQDTMPTPPIQTFVPDMNDMADAEQLFNFGSEEVKEDIREDIHDTKDITSYVGEPLCDTDGLVNPYDDEKEGIIKQSPPKKKKPDKDIDLFGDLKPTEKAWWNKYKVLMAIIGVLGGAVAVSFGIFFCTYFFGGKIQDNLGTQIKEDIQPTTSSTDEVSSTTSSVTDIVDFKGELVPVTPPPDNIQINSEKYQLLRVDFDKLKAKYPNVVGWLTIPGTEIEYPVTQCDDNEYYLSHSINGTYTRSGWVFADYRMTDTLPMRNYIIYGHNMADGTSFGKLKRCIANPEWLSNPDNQYIYYTTEYYTAVYQVFNVMKVKSTSVYYHNRELDNTTMLDYLNQMSTYNLYKDKLTYATPFKATDKVITLSTCNDAQGYEKFVVQGILVHSEKLKDPDNVVELE